jgi:hypothetical protein
MKRLALALIAFVVPSYLAAWEIEDNPDRFPSMAFDADAGTLEDSNIEKKVSRYGVSIRLPLADVFTADIRMARETEEQVAGAVSNRLSGNVFGGTLRYYFVTRTSSEKREAEQRVRDALERAN